MSGAISAAPMVMQVAGTALQIAGSFQKANAYGTAAKRATDSAEYQAKQLEINAGQEQAAAQRDSANQELQTKIAMSRALAVASASGGGASDPTIINLMARMAGEGQYRSMVALYQGDERARSLRDQASATRYSGELAAADYRAAERSARTTAGFRVASTVIDGASSLFKKYGQGGPVTKTADWDTSFDNPADYG